ncbi:44936_t:CDS:1, partial [Gigaspora margarita]
FNNGNKWKLTSWCPLGKIAKDGKIDSKYPIKETLATDYKQRTKWNVFDANATLIILSSSTFNTNLDGTGFTINMTEKHKKPCLQICLEIVLVGDCLDLNEGTKKKIDQVLNWIKNNKIKHLNMASPRE